MKILIAGDVDGKFDRLFARVEATQRQCGPFTCLFCVGRFFSSTSKDGTENAKSLEYLRAATPVPIPTYFIVGNSSDVELPEEGGEICPNLHFLGKGGISNIHGLHVAFASGTFDKYVQTAGVSTSTAYTQSSLRQIEVAAGASEFGRMVDLLLTAEWPKNLLSTVPQPVTFSGGSGPIAGLVKALQPRYHFAASENLFFSRPPYRNPDVPYPTRFFGLAGVSDSSDKHKKWLYAMNISPVREVGLRSFVEGSGEEVTDNPFSLESIQRKELQTQQMVKRQREAEEEQSGKRKRPAEDFECWFCIDKVRPDARHLVLSHGEFTYLSLPKGGLMDHHVLILPMEHFTGTNVIHSGVQDEITKYLNALAAFYKSRGQYMVYYERNIFKGKPMHMNLQVYPVDFKYSPEQVRDALFSRAVDCGLAFDSYEEGDRLPEQYFLFCLPAEKLIYRHFAKKSGVKFDPKFGRDIIAMVTERPRGADWRDCVKSTELEKGQAEGFKKAFRTFDWTQQSQGSQGPGK
eukprot:RCo042960